MRTLSCSILLLSLLLAAPAAQAGEMERKERAARLACLSGDYAKGVEILSELFIDTLNPSHIYNQGRCFEQSLKYAEAIGRFQEFLRVGKKLSKADQADAQKHIADCKELLANQSQPAAAVPAPAVALQSATPTAVAAPTPTIVQQPSSQRPGESGSTLRTAGIISAGFGAAALVTGVLLNLKVNSMASDLNKTDGYNAGKESDRKTYQTLGWVGYGAGAACLATGAILYYFGTRASSTDTTTVAFVPAFAPGQAGAVVKGAF